MSPQLFVVGVSAFRENWAGIFRRVPPQLVVVGGSALQEHRAETVSSGPAAIACCGRINFASEPSGNNFVGVSPVYLFALAFPVCGGTEREHFCTVSRRNFSLKAFQICVRTERKYVDIQSLGRVPR